MLVYDDTWLREPNLLVPGNNPIGPVRLVQSDIGIQGYYRQISGGNDPQILDLARGKLMERYLSGSGYDAKIDSYGRSINALSISSNIYTSDDVTPPADLTIFGTYVATASANSTDNVIGGFVQSENTNNTIGGNCAVAVYCARAYFGSNVVSLALTYADASTDHVYVNSTFTAGDVWSFAVAVESGSEIRLAGYNHTTKTLVTYKEALTKTLNSVSQPFTVAGFKPYAASYAWIRSAQNLYVYDIGWGNRAASMSQLVSLCRDPFQFLEPA